MIKELVKIEEDRMCKQAGARESMPQRVHRVVSKDCDCPEKDHCKRGWALSFPVALPSVPSKTR